MCSLAFFSFLSSVFFFLIFFFIFFFIFFYSQQPGVGIESGWELYRRLWDLHWCQEPAKILLWRSEVQIFCDVEL